MNKFKEKEASEEKRKESPDCNLNRQSALWFIQHWKPVADLSLVEMSTTSDYISFAYSKPERYQINDLSQDVEIRCAGCVYFDQDMYSFRQKVKELFIACGMEEKATEEFYGKNQSYFNRPGIVYKKPSFLA
jgi:hypothetical protein